MVCDNSVGVDFVNAMNISLETSKYNFFLGKMSKKSAKLKAS